MWFFRMVRYEWTRFPKLEAAWRIGQYLRFIWRWRGFKDNPKARLNDFEMRMYSQNGEDGILQYIFHKIGAPYKHFVEIGMEDGTECNTRYLRELGWRGLGMDGNYESRWVKKEWVTRENVERLFHKYSVPKMFDLLSIDIDFNDYWVWKAITRYHPTVVVIEYNSAWGTKKKKVVRYNPKFTKPDGSGYFGASLSALVELGKQKGYRLVACDEKGINAFFVTKEKAGILIPASYEN